MRSFIHVTVCALVLACPAFVLAQSATTATIAGIVTDAQGSGVPGATVSLRDQATNVAQSGTTNQEGRYLFASLSPGTYELTVTLDGFQKMVIQNLRAEVTRTVTQDVRLAVAGVAESVVVVASDTATLQRTDAAVGNTFDAIKVAVLPNPTRDVMQLVTLQPAATPSGEIAGARGDQSTFTLDGVDISDNSFGDVFRTIFPTPADAIEEFQATVANPNASFARSSGGQFTFITRRGTNDFHGSVYEYHQNARMNANSWTNNRLGLAKPPGRDNRFGASIGGPVLRNRTFFFGMYEGRRGLGSATVTRLVPTDSLKGGMLRFRDATGAVQTIDPRALDPRGLGASPAMLELLRQYPSPNDASAGDGLNTAGYTAAYDLATDSNLGIFRVDQVLGNAWNLEAGWKQFREEKQTIDQVSVASGRLVAGRPARPYSVTAALTGVLTPRLTNDIRFGLVHDEDVVDRVPPSPQIPGLNIAVDFAGTLLDEPTDVGRAASAQGEQVNVIQVIDNLTWSKNNHTVQAGFSFRHFQAEQYRTNKVIGSITTPTAVLGSATFNAIPAAQRPGFIQAADVARYNQLYASLLGQVESIGYLATRNGQLQPNPAGTPLQTDVSMNAWQLYASDSWRFTPSLTMTYGLTYQLSQPPTEREGRQMVAVYAADGRPVDPREYLRLKLEAAHAGGVHNPPLAWAPVSQLDQPVFRLDKNNFSPRVALAWNPEGGEGAFGRLVGDRRTVLRGGYSLLYDRINNPTFITIPTLGGPGFAQIVSLNAPAGSSGQVFRAGVDGPLPLPTIPAASAPVAPSVPFGETLAFGLDPYMDTPKSHMINLSVQRVLPWDMSVEAGYVGRLGRDLMQTVNLNQVPYMFRDPASGQTFAQAFDAVAAELRAGTAPAAVTLQPWFENLLSRLGPGATRAMAVSQAANIVNGNLSALFLGFLDAQAAAPFNNRQVQDISMRTTLGRSSYHALVSSVRKRFAQGLTFDVNYTLSSSKDQVGLTQNQATILPNSFDPDAEWGPSNFDLRHVMNANWVYELPLARNASGVRERLLGGWYTAGVFRATSGAPLTIVQGAQVWGGALVLTNNSGAVPGGEVSTGINRNVAGSGGVGTSGDPARGGSGINLLSDPEAVFRAARRIRLGTDDRAPRGVIRGPGFWQLDATFGKTTTLGGGTRLKIAVDILNILNHINFADPTLSLQIPATFGVITAQRIDEFQVIVPRRVQVSGRFEF